MASHGTVSAYNAGCHCPRCQAAMASYRRARRARGRDGGEPSRTGAARSPGARTRGPTSHAASPPSPSPSPSRTTTGAPRMSPSLPGRRTSQPGPGASPGAQPPVPGHAVAVEWAMGPVVATAPTADPQRPRRSAGMVPTAPAGRLPTAAEIRRQAATKAPGRVPELRGPFGDSLTVERTRRLWRQLTRS